MLQFLFYLNPSFTKGGEKQSNTHPRKQFLFREEGCGLTGRAPQLQGASLFSCPRSSSAPQDWSGLRARTPPGCKVPEGPLSSLGIPFSGSFHPLARPQAGAHPTTSEWGCGGQP